MLNQQQIEDGIAKLRASYAAFKKGDIDTAVRFLDPQVEWVEPAESQVAELIMASRAQSIILLNHGPALLR